MAHAHPLPSAPDQPAAPRAPLPRTIAWVTLGLAALVALHLIIPVVMVLQPDAIAAGIRQANPGLSPENVALGLRVALIASVLFHLLFAALYAWLAVMLRRGRRWARLALTLLLALATLASGVSYSSSPLFRAIIPAADLLQILLIGLLWLPRRTKH